MTINIKVGNVGLVDINPEFVFIETTDPIATVLGTGYLNSSVPLGYQFSNSQIAFVKASDAIAMLKVNVVDGVVTLAKSIQS